MAPRRYNSDSRADSARRTRRQIVTHADQLFRDNGYAGTTLGQIASAAGVSVQTVYNLIGGKGAVLKAVYDVALAGDDTPVAMTERPLVRAMIAASEPETVLTLYAQMAREIAERVGPLVTVVLAHTASGDPQLMEFAQTIERERGIGTAAVARQLATRFGLRAGIDESQAADILCVLTAPEIPERLVKNRKWSWNTYQQWLAQTMTDALLGTSTTDRASRQPAPGDPT